MAVSHKQMQVLELLSILLWFFFPGLMSFLSQWKSHLA